MTAPGDPKNRVPLENYANNAASQWLTPALAAGSDRASRYARRQFLWDMSTLKRVRKCGRTRVSPDGLVALRDSLNVRGLHGLSTCASIWACPVCNAKVMSRRALEIQAAVALAQSLGYSVGFVTLTMRHHRGQRLSDLWDALSGAWRKVTACRSFKHHEGLVGFIRATEVTHGRNGWHVHVHALVVLDTKHPVEDLDAVANSMWRTWSRALAAAGLDDPLRRAQDWKVLDGPAHESLSRYLTKSVDGGLVGLELASTQTKHARSDFGTVTPWHLLALSAGGDADAFRNWCEWEAGSHGRRQISWSRELRKLLGLGQELTDDEIATEEFGTAADDVLWILPEGWTALVRRPNRHLIAQLFEIPRADLSQFLTSNSINHLTRYQP